MFQTIHQNKHSLSQRQRAIHLGILSCKMHVVEEVQQTIQQHTDKEVQQTNDSDNSCFYPANML